MSKYMVQFSYTEEGLKGLVKEGGSKRREAVEQMFKTIGSKLEAFYFAFGEYDGITIIDAKDEASYIASLLAINSSGAVKTKTTVLIALEDVDQAVKKLPAYRAPGK